MNFHNNTNDKSTVLNIHGAYKHIYGFNAKVNTLQDMSTKIMGAAHNIVHVFNTVISWSMSVILDKPLRVHKQEL